MDNSGSLAFGFTMIGICLVLYFMPYIVAKLKNSPDSTSIFVINLFLGWLLIPWVIALAWALRGNNKKPLEKVATVLDADMRSLDSQAIPPRTGGHPDAIFGAHSTNIEPISRTSLHKICPFCAEEVKVEAIRCKHCQADLTATPA